MAEERAEQVAAEQGAGGGQPHHEGVERLPAGCRDEHELAAADHQLEAVLDGARRFGLGLGDGPDPERAGVLHGGDDRVDPGEGRVAGAERLEALVVLAPHDEVRLGDHVGVGVAQHVDAADVVVVPLGEDERAGRGGIDRVVRGAVQGALEAHARVHDDAALVGADQVAVRQALVQPDAVADVDGRGVGGRRDRIGSGPLAVDAGHQNTSRVTVGNASNENAKRSWSSSGSRPKSVRRS